MKLPAFDRDLARTVLFSMAVVLMIIGIYQTILQNDIVRNYWLFAVASGCLLIYRALRQPVAPPAAAVPKAKPASKAPRKPKGRR